MEKCYKTLVCPICSGNDINMDKKKDAKKEYSVAYRNAKLVIYRPCVYVSHNDVNGKY